MHLNPSLLLAVVLVAIAVAFEVVAVVAELHVPLPVRQARLDPDVAAREMAGLQEQSRQDRSRMTSLAEMAVALLFAWVFGGPAAAIGALLGAGMIVGSMLIRDRRRRAREWSDHDKATVPDARIWP